MLDEAKKNEIIEQIMQKTGKSKEEIIQLVQDKVEEMDFLVNELGAVYIIANDLGLNITEDNTLTIQKLNPGQSNITIIARVSKVFQPRTFTRKDGSKGVVRNLEVIDKTGSARVALWDVKAAMIEEKGIIPGNIIRISGANVKEGYNNTIELSIGAQGIIEPVTNVDESEFPEITVAQLVDIEKIRELEDGTFVSVKGKIIEQRKITEFEKKDGNLGKVTSIRLKDTTGHIKITFWDQAVETLQHYSIGDSVKLTELRISSSDYGKELTYTYASSISKIDDPSLDPIEIIQANTIDTLDQLRDGLSRITVTGKIVFVSDPTPYEKDGITKYRGSMTLQDASKAVRVALWGEKTINLLKNIGTGKVIRITNAFARYNDYSGEVELSIGENSNIEDITDSCDLARYTKEPEFITINEVANTRYDVSINVQVLDVFEPREVTLKDGSTKMVYNLKVIDTNGDQARVAAWDEDGEKIKDCVEGDALILRKVRIKPSSGEYLPEILIRKDTEVEKTDPENMMPIIQSAMSYQQSKLNYEVTTLNLVEKEMRVEIKGTIVQIYKPGFYTACIKCARKVETDEFVNVGVCKEHGEVETRPVMIISMVLDDTTDTIKAVLFDKTAEKFLGITANEAIEMIKRLSSDEAPIQDMEMKDVIVKGKVVFDDYSEDLKLNVDKIEFLDHASETDKLLDALDY